MTEKRPSRTRASDTGAPQRNFDLPTEERMRALVSGPPAFARRLRAIEDLEEAIVRLLVKEMHRARLDGQDPSRCMRDRFPLAAHQRLRDLIGSHNRFYPIEANLPICLRTGQLLERGAAPWRPRPCPSMEELFARAASHPPR